LSIERFLIPKPFSRRYQPMEGVTRTNNNEHTDPDLGQYHPALALCDQLGFEVEEGVERQEERSGRPVIRLRSRRLDKCPSQANSRRLR
jgi:hypothetical protein